MSLTRNAALNLVGQVLPLFLAVVAIPLLVGGLGTDRFGVLTLAWMVIGYFSLFDLGLGRALTQLVAQRLGEEREDEVPVLTGTGLVLMGVLGVVGAIVLAAAASVLVQRVLNIPLDLQGESTRALLYLALSLPIVIVTTGLRGVLEAYQRFDIVNLIRVPMGAYTFAGPLLVLPFAPTLPAVILALLAGRFLALLAHVVGTLRAVPRLRRECRFDRAFVSPLLRFGGWMTVSNIISPLMVYFDRFIVAVLLSVTAVAYYVTPYELVTKLLLIPAALMGVLFPAIATALAAGGPRAVDLFARAVRVLFVPMFPLVLVLVAWAPEILDVWLGADFALHGTAILRWLAVGVFVNALALIPFSVVQAVGRPDLTAKLHVAELPFYLVGGYVLVMEFGLEGAAVAWVIRAAVDAVALFIIAARVLPGAVAGLRAATVPMALALLALGVVVVPEHAIARSTLLVGILCIFAPLSWRYLVGPGERAALRSLLKLPQQSAARP